jgi:nitrate reductase assembly molybdenum cofactor insertion protein NarJ
MIESSKDILFVVLAACAGLLTLFTCLVIFYLAMILKNMNKMVSSIREKMELVDKILRLIKEKLEKTSSHLALVTDSLIKLVGFVMDKQKEKKKSGGKKGKR